MPVLLLAPMLLALLAAGAGCTNASYRKAESSAALGNWDDAVIHYLEALENDPQNIKYRAALTQAKMKASQDHFQKGKQFEKAKVLERSLVEYQQAVQLDPTNQYAAAQLEKVRRELAAQREKKDYGTIEQMKNKTRGARPQPPLLNPRSTQPISLEFPQPVSIFQIYRALAQAFGINVLFDPNLKDQEIAINLKDVTAQAALETLMRAAGHFYKVIDEHSILIAADTPQNRRTYEDLVIQTFFLSNSEVKDMTSILRSLIDAKKIATNDQLNAIILRDTTDKVKVAEKIIETNDKAKAEVVVDVELLQIDTSRMRELGIDLSSYTVTQSLDLGGTGGGTTTGTGTGTTGSSGGATTPAGALRLSDIPFLNQGSWLLTIPSFIYKFIKQDTDAQLLAKPQLRITEGQKASLVIGDKVPIPLTTFNTSNTLGGSIVPITSFQYQDVGIKIEIEPRVHHNQEVTLKVKIEVSNLGAFIPGTTQPIIGTRTIDSTIRLQDGETNFLAGLVRTDESKGDNGVPGLSEIPIIGRLFSDKSHSTTRKDVILTLTPHIIRNAEITEDDLLPIGVGTEANITFRPGSPRIEADVEGPFDGNEGTPEEIQDAIRRRIQRLPRGLQGGEEGEEPPAQPPPGTRPPPPGQNLAPATGPSDIFRQPPPAQPPPQQNPPPQPPPENEGALLRPPAGAAAGGAEESTAVAESVATAPENALAAGGGANDPGVTAAGGEPYTDYAYALSAAGAAPSAAARAVPAAQAGAASQATSGATAGQAAQFGQAAQSNTSAVASGPPGATPKSAPSAATASAPARPAVTARSSAAAAAAAAGPAVAVRLWLAPRQLDVAAGDQFEVQVQVAADRPISHLPLTLSFDPARLAVVRVAPGEFFGEAGQAEVLADYSRPGEVVVGASRLGNAAGVAGAGTLVRVTFRALAEGSALVGFARREALDQALRPVLPITVQPAAIEVGGGGGSPRKPSRPAPQRQPEAGGKVAPRGPVGN
ncbi:MAG TPA: cohesin domain-containing protein [Thermoanaerobaculia bacterium]|nr:cohesin domain-containing protein [Thermoanaerobaculia bacterium]